MNPKLRTARIVLPVVMGVLCLVAWEAIVRGLRISPHILPGPADIGRALVEDWPLLSAALWVTLKITASAFVSAVLVGGAIAILFSLSKWIELTFFPYAVIMQVTPVVAIAPLLIIWVDNVQVALLICAWLVAFFPILSNSIVGLNSADHNLRDLFRLYGATPGQTLRRLRIPSAMPYFLAGVRISGGLSLIGAVVAEFVAGAGGQGSGLAYRILEAGYQLKTPRMFAALLMISCTGVLIFLATSWVSQRILRRWHESAMERES